MTKKPSDMIRHKQNTGPPKRYWNRASSILREKPSNSKVTLKPRRKPCISFGAPWFLFTKVGDQIYWIEKEREKSKRYDSVFPIRNEAGEKLCLNKLDWKLCVNSANVAVNLPKMYQEKPRTKPPVLFLDFRDMRKKHYGSLSAGFYRKSRDSKRGSKGIQTKWITEPVLSQNFKKAFLNYKKNPNPKSKDKLKLSARSIYEYAVKIYGIEADKNWEPMYDIVKSALQGITINSAFNRSLISVCDELFNFGDNAFNVISMAVDFLNPIRSCLRGITKHFLIFQDKMDRAFSEINPGKAYSDSFLSPLNNPDLKKAGNNKKMIDSLFHSLSTEIFSKSKANGENFFPAFFNTVESKANHIENHINTLHEHECIDIFLHLQKEIKPILNRKANLDHLEEGAKLASSEKQSALKNHSFNVNYDGFFATILQNIKELFKIRQLEIDNVPSSAHIAVSLLGSD